MDLQHPVEMRKLGCTDQMKVNISFQAYMKLCEVDKLWNVEYLYDKELDIIYLSSTVKKEQVLHVPVPMYSPLSPAMLHSISTTLLKSHQNAAINILLRTPDTSILPYKLTAGLCPPPDPESTKERKGVQEKLQYIHSELNKRKVELYEEAKHKRFASTQQSDDNKCENDKQNKTGIKAESGDNVSVKENPIPMQTSDCDDLEL